MASARSQHARCSLALCTFVWATYAHAQPALMPAGPPSPGSGAPAHITAVPPRVSRTTFARQGYMVISAERLTVAYASKETFDSTLERNLAGSASTIRSSSSSSDIGVAFLGSAYSPWSALPRLAYDHFVLDGLSLGVSFVYASRSDSESARFEELGQSATQDTSPTRSAWLANGRVGYAMVFSEVFGFWGRVGFTFVSTTDERHTTQSNATGGSTPSSSKVT